MLADRPTTYRLERLSQCLADGFEIWSFCEADPNVCLRNAKLDLRALIDRLGDLEFASLRRRLKCRACGRKSIAIRLVAPGGAPCFNAGVPVSQSSMPDAG